MKRNPSKSTRNARRAGTAAQRKRFLEKVHLHAAGIDIGAEAHWVAVPEDRDAQPVRKFSSFTRDLERLADWLHACGIQTVAMESTGVYWIPLFELLEQRGFEVLLVNARHVKNVPGRKSDVVDCQWLQQLHSFGLLRGSFRPKAEIVALRSYLRHRDKLVEGASAFILRMHKALTQMNVQLHHVISDLSGHTGLRIVRAIVAGQTDPEQLAEYRDPHIRASKEQIRESLRGQYRAEHLFQLRQALEFYDFSQQQIAACDEQIHARLRELEARCEPPQAPLPPAAKRRRPGAFQAPGFEIRSPLYVLCKGVDLTELPGIGPQAALTLISEVGLDLERWPTEKHFSAWLTLSPHTKRSGDKLLSSRTQSSANRAARTFRIAAMSLSRTDHALGAFYRRLAVRIGKAKAITATARKLAVLFYQLLRRQIVYREHTQADYDQRLRSRVLARLRKRAHSLGFDLTERPAEPLSNPGVS